MLNAATAGCDKGRGANGSLKSVSRIADPDFG